MLAKKYKVPIEEFFKKTPKKKKFGVFLFSFSENNLKNSRFGILISKKVSAKATKRNYLKRVIFETVKKNKFYEKPGKDVLVSVPPAAKDLKKEEIEEKIKKELSELLK